MQPANSIGYRFSVTALVAVLITIMLIGEFYQQVYGDGYPI